MAPAAMPPAGWHDAGGTPMASTQVGADIAQLAALRQLFEAKATEVELVDLTTGRPAPSAAATSDATSR